jgi:hypothetical protein
MILKSNDMKPFPFISPLLEVRCDRLGLFPDDCRDLEEVTSDSALGHYRRFYNA